MLQDLESSVIAVRNQKLKEEKEAATKGKKGAHTAGLRCIEPARCVLNRR